MSYFRQYFRRRARRRAPVRVTRRWVAGTPSPVRNSERIYRLEKGWGKERKTHDTSISTNINNTSTITLLSGIAQGDESVQREGLVVQPSHMQYRIWCNANASSTGADYVRVIIFRDKEQHGTAPVATDILESDSFEEFCKHENRIRFQILRDFLIKVDTGTNRSVIKKGIIKFNKKQRLHYIGTAGTAANMGRNTLYVLFIGNAVSNVPYLIMETRLRFTDA